MKGLKIFTTNSGIKYKNRDDLLLIIFENFASVAGVFTKNTMCAAPVTWCKKILKKGIAKALIVNAGNANAYTGKIGFDSIEKKVSFLSLKINCKKNEIFISSTGVIGEDLKTDLIIKSIDSKISIIENEQYNASEDDFIKASGAILTTDTTQKFIKKTCFIGKDEVTIYAFAKGAGMIAPNMATMLAYFFTDAKIDSQILQLILKEAVDNSFNMITVDSDQSTNDTVLFFSTNKVGKNITDINDKQIIEFKKIVKEMAIYLAKRIVVDGEGAKKTIEIQIINYKNEIQAKKVAFSIANSPLVKTAIAGADPNWGRIIMAIGKTEYKFSQEKIQIWFGDFLVAKNGRKSENYIENNVHNYLKDNENVIIRVDLGINKNNPNPIIVWTSDLNEEYIKINKDYRS